MHGKIYAGIARLIERGEPVNAIAVRALADNADLQAVGGLAYLTGMMAASPDAETAEQRAGRVADLHRRRTIIARAETVAASARLQGGRDDSVLDAALAELTSAARDRVLGGGLVASWTNPASANLDNVVLYISVAGFDVATVEYTDRSGASATPSHQATWPVLASGTYSVWVRAFNAAGTGSVLVGPESIGPI